MGALNLPPRRSSSVQDSAQEQPGRLRSALVVEIIGVPLIRSVLVKSSRHVMAVLVLTL